MTEQVQESWSGIDAAKLSAALIVLVAGITGFYLLSAQPLWVRWLIVLGALVATIVVALQSTPGKALWQFVQSARIELRKVVWPTQQETLQVTLLVFVAVFIGSVFFWGVDWVLAHLTRWLTEQRS